MSLDAKLNMGPLQIACSGNLDITKDGLYGSLVLAADINLGTAGGSGGSSGIIQLFGAASFEINTTGESQTVKQYNFDFGTGQISNTPVNTTLPAASSGTPFIQVLVEGKLELFDAFTVEGQFIFQLSGGDLQIAINAHLNAFFGVDLNFTGFASFSSAGVVLDVETNISIGISARAELLGDGRFASQYHRLDSDGQ